MKKVYKNESGFSAVEVLLVILILVVIGAVGYMVYHNNHKTTASTTTNTKPATAAKITTTTPDPYAGWISCSDTSEGLSFKYPSTWTATGIGTGGACTADSEHQLSLYSPQVSSVPYFFRVEYFPTSASDGVIDGDNGTETILSVKALSVLKSKVPLYLVAFNAPGSSSSNDVFEFVLTDQNYTVGQTVDHVKAAASQKVSGDHYQLTANMVTEQGQQYLGEYTLAQYEAQPDYNSIIKLFESLGY